MELTLRDSRDRAAAWAHSVLDEARDGGRMALRTNNPMKLRAHAVLDDVRAGMYHGDSAVTWALRVLGEPVDGKGRA